MNIDRVQNKIGEIFDVDKTNKHLLGNDWITNRPIVHRGLWDNRNPENSIGSFQNAISKNYPIEIDIRFLSDGIPVVFHDATLARMCGQNTKLFDIPYKDLKEYRLSGTDWKIPTLRETLEFVNGRVPILMEAKQTINMSWFNKSMYNELVHYSGKLAIFSFNPFTLSWFKQHDERIMRVHAASEFIGYTEGNAIIRAMLRRMKFMSVSQPHAIGYDIKSLPNMFIEHIINAGIPIIGWTVRNKSEEKFAREYCDNIIFEGYYA